MNPARLHALFDAYFGKTGKRISIDPEPQEERSLSAYFMGGG